MRRDIARALGLQPEQWLRLRGKYSTPYKRVCIDRSARSSESRYDKELLAHTESEKLATAVAVTTINGSVRRNDCARATGDSSVRPSAKYGIQAS